MPICPNCGNQTADNAIFCDQCGTKIPAVEPEPEAPVVETPVSGVPEGVLVCPDCGAENVPGEVFCDVCGNPLEAPEPVSAAEPAPAASAPQPETYCSTCGGQIGANDTFCANCGAAVGGAPTEMVEEVAPDFGDGAAEEILIEETLLDEPIVEVVEEILEDEPALEVVEETLIEEPLVEVIEEEVIDDEIVGELEIEEEPLLEVIEEVVAEEPELAVTEGRCPVCGASTLADQTFCASCGAALQAAAPAQPSSAPAPSSAGTYLEVLASGAQIPVVEQPELLVGREDQVSGIYPEIDLTPHRGEDGGVSRRHAKLIYEGGVWFVMDLDSTNGTYLNGVELQPKIRAALNDGDTLSLGDVEFVFHA